MIPFNKPYLSGKEIQYIQEAIHLGKISGNGVFTTKCQNFFEEHYSFNKCLLTTSCTDALEMCAMLIDVKEGDEIIIPSFTFVSTANAFVLRGANIVFADSQSSHPNIDASKLEGIISSRTKAIVVVHYAGVACEMDEIMALAKKYNLFVIEDAAQAIDSYYNGKPLGSIGHLAAFSFHETKNIISGEGGMLVINDKQFESRAEILWEKGTNRTAFFKGEVAKYSWVDIGSSFLPSEIIAAFLLGQLDNIEIIQQKRKEIWSNYFNGLKKIEESGLVKLPHVPAYASNNAHMFYLVCKDASTRDNLISYLRNVGAYCVFHYISLHKSPFYESKHASVFLPNSDSFSECLVRLPFFFEITDEQQQLIIREINSFFKIR